MSLRRYTRPIPFNYTTYGQYSLGATSGIIPATPLANKEVFQFRWNPTNTALLAAIRRVSVSAAVSTTYFAAGVPVEVTMTKCTGWSAQGTLGTAITPAATCKLRTSMASTGLADGDARIAGTDANGLGAGTKTLEANPMRSILSGQPITSSLSGQVFSPQDIFWADVGHGMHPLLLVATEGFALRATAPATGTWRLSVNVDWDETISFPYGDTVA